MKNFPDKFRTNPHSGVIAEGKLAHWFELLNEWYLLHQQYRRVVHDDAIFWCTEQSNVSTLASAAWRSEWVAIQEIQCDRIFALESPFQSERNRGRGRCDLYLKCSRSEDWVEAKNHDCMDGSDQIGIKQAIEAACDDVMNLDIEVVNERTKRVGVVFVIPSSPEDCGKSWESFFFHFCKNIASQNLDAIAWCFPHLDKPLMDGGYGHYGVLLLAKVYA